MRVILSEALALSGVSHVIGRRYQGRGMVFMLHSIVDDTAPYIGQTLRCSTATLERALNWVHRRGLDVVTLNEARRRLQDPQAKRFVVFTFDDGYRDNLTHALPLMERFDAPFTIYVPSRILTRELNGWWLGLVPLVRDRDTVEIAAMGRRFDTSTTAGKRAAMTEIGRWVFEDGLRTSLLAPTFAQYGISTATLLDQEAMTADELRSIAEHPLVTIGAHTLTHPFLSQLPEAEAAREIAACKGELEAVLARPVEHFSYPYGAAGNRESEIARAAGYATAVTTANGTLFDSHATGAHRFAWPRETLDEHDTEGCLECRTRGVYRFLKSRGGSPVASYRQTA